jgi:hypothetical protein
MALTAAERQARYRATHPEKIAAYKTSEARKISDEKYREKHGTHPMNKAGTDSYKKYRASEKYRRSYMNGHLKRKYGITLEKYKELVEAQNGVCKICGGITPNRDWKDGRKQWLQLFVDHDHKTGKIRGLLCNTCNVGISLLKDDIRLLESAIRYLKES